MRTDIARYLDHAVLKPDLTQADTEAAIILGIKYNVCSVCVRPSDILMAKNLCQGTDTTVSCVLNFPHGVGLSESKADEARRYAEMGVAEIDMVANYGLIRSGIWNRVLEDIAGVALVTRSAGIMLKVILETSELSSEQMWSATEASINAGADFVKTSTGFASGSATEEAVRAMLDAAGGRIQVKASGGIRDIQRAEMFLDMGCTRLGVNYSSTPVICSGNKSNKGGENNGY